MERGMLMAKAGRSRVQPRQSEGGPLVIDFPVIDFPVIDFPVIDFPVIDFPVIDFPVIDFPVIGAASHN
jgi:hypothetical protein